MTLERASLAMWNRNISRMWTTSSVSFPKCVDGNASPACSRSQREGLAKYIILSYDLLDMIYGEKIGKTGTKSGLELPCYEILGLKV